MVRRWDDLGETHRESPKHLEPMHVHWMKCAKCHAPRKMCPRVRTVRCYLYTSRRVRDICQCLDAKVFLTKNSMADECARPHRKMRIQVGLTTVETVFARNQFAGATLASWSCQSSGCHSRHC